MGFVLAVGWGGGGVVVVAVFGALNFALLLSMACLGSGLCVMLLSFIRFSSPMILVASFLIFLPF